MQVKKMLMLGLSAAKVHFELEILKLQNVIYNVVLYFILKSSVLKKCSLHNSVVSFHKTMHQVISLRKIGR